MARRLGQDFRLYVDNGSGTFNPILGEKSLNIDATTNLVDQSAKQDGQYAKQTPVRSTFQMVVSGVEILPDTNGLERLYALAIARTVTNFQVRRTPFSGSDVAFQAANMAVSSFNRTNADQANAEFTATVTLTDTDPSINTL